MLVGATTSKTQSGFLLLAYMPRRSEHVRFHYVVKLLANVARTGVDIAN